MAELGAEVSAAVIAREYRGLCDVLVIDVRDAALADAVRRDRHCAGGKGNHNADR